MRAPTSYLLIVTTVFCTIGSSAAAVFLISEEAGGNNIAGRAFADTLPGTTGWSSAVNAAGLNTNAIGTTTSTSFATGTGNTLVFGGGLNATISSVDFSEVPATLGSAIFATDAARVLDTAGNALQDLAPTPTSLVGTPRFTDTGGSTVTRNGFLFNFNQNVNGFGAFFGDLETANSVGPGGFTGTDPNAPNPGLDGSGRRLAEVFLYDAAGILIGMQSVLASNGAFSVNGTPYVEGLAGSAAGAQTFTGAGNEPPRHIAVLGNGISSVLVVVGDDDTNIHDGTDAMGNREFLSTVGFQAFVVPEPSRALLLGLSAGFLILGRRR